MEDAIVSGVIGDDSEAKVTITGVADRPGVSATLFRARVVDVATDALVIEVTGDSAKVSALLRVLEPYGIKEIAQSGLIAIGRGSKSITERIYKS